MDIYIYLYLCVRSFVCFVFVGFAVEWFVRWSNYVWTHWSPMNNTKRLWIFAARLHTFTWSIGLSGTGWRLTIMCLTEANRPPKLTRCTHILHKHIYTLTQTASYTDTETQFFQCTFPHGLFRLCFFCKFCIVSSSTRYSRRPRAISIWRGEQQKQQQKTRARAAICR